MVDTKDSIGSVYRKRYIERCKFGELLTGNADDNAEPSFTVYKEGVETIITYLKRLINVTVKA